jgi:hypothetical protein
LRWPWPSNEPLTNIRTPVASKVVLITILNLNGATWIFLAWMMAPSNSVCLDLCISLTHDSFFDVAAGAAFPMGFLLMKV